MDRLEFAAEYEVSGDTFTGIAHVFGQRTFRDGRFHEFEPTSFGDSIGQTLAFYSHDRSKPLARPAVEVRDGRLSVSMTLGHQSYAEDLRENQRLGLMRSMSFGVEPSKWNDRREKDGSVTRVYTAARLVDVSPVAIPAFERGTSSAIYSGPAEDRRVQMARARHRVMEVHTHG